MDRFPLLVPEICRYQGKFLSNSQLGDCFLSRMVENYHSVKIFKLGDSRGGSTDYD